MCDESATDFLLSMTVVVALVVLVFCDQLVQFWVAVLVGDTAGDPLLDPLQYHIVVVFAGHRSTVYPQEDVVVWYFFFQK